MLEEKEYYVEKIVDVMHPDGWGYRLEMDEETVSIQYIDKSIDEEMMLASDDKIHISTLMIRNLAKEILKFLPEEKDNG